MTPSTILITLNGVDITNRVLYKETTFTTQANPIQGTFKLAVKDVDQTFAPVAGQKVACHIDGVPLFGGYVMGIGRGTFHPVEDTTNPNSVARKWTLTGPDFNVLFDKRVLRDLADPTAYLGLPTDKQTISKAFRYMMNNFLDVPTNLDWDTHVDVIRTRIGSIDGNAGLVGQGKTWRDQMEDFVDHGAVMYYIDADFAMHLHDYEHARVDWLFSDYHPNGVNTVGFREGEYFEDMSQMVTEALVWGGSSIRSTDGGTEGDIVFAKYPTAPASNVTVWNGTDEERVFTAAKEQEALDRRNQYGRWQMAEERAGQENYLSYDSVITRAVSIIQGPPGVPETYGQPSGFSRPLKSMRCSWFAHDVPGAAHIRAGYLVDFTLYTQSLPPFTLPCRSITISFPTLPADSPGDAYVRFDGDFGVSHSDRRFLWKRMKRQRNELFGSNPIVLVDNTSTSVPPGSYQSVYPLEETNGTRTVFTFPFTFYKGEFDLFLNGLIQRDNLDYSYDAATKQVTFVVAPDAADNIWAGGYGGA